MSLCSFELTIERVSAPGVWLASSKDVFITIRAFGDYRRTCKVPPVFPLSLYQSFRFEKKFFSAVDSLDVARALEGEEVEIELLQHDVFYDGLIKLASFSTNAREFLFPYPSLSPAFSTASKEIVLFRSALFPGLSPKLEFSVKTNITRDVPLLTSSVSYRDRVPVYSRYEDDDAEVAEITSDIRRTYISTPRIRPRSAGPTLKYRSLSPAPLLSAADKLEIELEGDRARARAEAEISLRKSLTSPFRPYTSVNTYRSLTPTRTYIPTRSYTPTRTYTSGYQRSTDDLYLTRNYTPRYSYY